jgi:hypothetical protein
MSDKLEALVAHYHSLKKLNPEQQLMLCTTIECVQRYVTRWIRPVFHPRICYTWDVDECGRWALFLCKPSAGGFVAYAVDPFPRRLFAAYNEDIVGDLLPTSARALSGVPHMSSDSQRRRIRSLLGVRCEKNAALTAIAATQLITAAENETWHFDALVRDMHRALDCHVQPC